MLKPKPLSPKEAAFVLAYMKTGNASEAYRRAYNDEPRDRQPRSP